MNVTRFNPKSPQTDDICGLVDIGLALNLKGLGVHICDKGLAHEIVILHMEDWAENGAERRLPQFRVCWSWRFLFERRLDHFDDNLFGCHEFSLSGCLRSGLVAFDEHGDQERGKHDDGDDEIHHNRF